jgi:hypothetical protein
MSHVILVELEGLTTLLQILYLISTFGVLPQPDFIIIVFISVSTVHVFLRHIFSGTEYRLNTGFISDAHNRPCWNANEPSRTLLNPLHQNAVRSRASARAAQGYQHATTRVHHSSGVRERP